MAAAHMPCQWAEATCLLLSLNRGSKHIAVKHAGQIETSSCLWAMLAHHIANLGCETLSQQDIGALEITVKDALGVQEAQAMCNVQGYAAAPADSNRL